jgi:hypothetical protein
VLDFNVNVVETCDGTSVLSTGRGKERGRRKKEGEKGRETDTALPSFTYPH